MLGVKMTLQKPALETSITGALSFTPAYLSRVWMNNNWWIPLIISPENTHEQSKRTIPVQRRGTRVCPGWLRAGRGSSCWDERGSSSCQPAHFQLHKLHKFLPKLNWFAQFSPFRSIRDDTCQSWFCGDAGHQRFRDLRGASCACRSCKDLVSLATIIKMLDLTRKSHSKCWNFWYRGWQKFCKPPFERPNCLARLAPDYNMSTAAWY